MDIGISEEIRIRGCEQNPKIIVPDAKLLEIYELIRNFDMDQVAYNPETLRSVLKKSYQFFERYYELHKVPYEEVRKIGKYELSIEGMRSPFRLPIRRVDEDVYYGLLNEFVIFGEKPRWVFRHVELPKKITEVSTLSYVHEITHSQDNHIYGSIKNYYNTEVLSIFNELLCAGSMDDGGRLLYLNDVVRLHNLRFGIQTLQDYRDKEDEFRDQLLEGSCYVESTVKAYNMYMDYIEGDRRTREYIILMIQKVFDGEITLEQCLEVLDVTYQNSLNSKRLAKYLKR